ncbi:hypothetical protein F6Y02_41075 (plasmid) [Bacillus megaterium]|nr:hypothetical protein [Priestia megaterium]
MNSELLVNPRESGNGTKLDEIQNHEEHKVVKQTTYLVIPFALNTDYISALKNLLSSTYTKRDGHEEKLWREGTFGRQRLFAHISNLIDRNAIKKKESIGTRLILEEPARSFLNLPNNRNTYLTFTPDKESFNFHLGNIELYLFETQVGFVVFDILYEEGEKIDNVILSNYHLKKIYQYKDDLKFLKKIGRDQQVEVNVQLYKLIETFLKGVQVETYFEDIKKRPSYAIVYSSTLIGANLKEEKTMFSY